MPFLIAEPFFHRRLAIAQLKLDNGIFLDTGNLHGVPAKVFLDFPNGRSLHQDYSSPAGRLRA